eukprot:6198427-Pleurochrysis_carterae.AAC.2
MLKQGNGFSDGSNIGQRTRPLRRRRRGSPPTVQIRALNPRFEGSSETEFPVHRDKDQANRMRRNKLDPFVMNALNRTGD